jgi:hypothetical protein
MWYNNEDGSLHPIAKDDARGARLREAFVNGNYDETAKEDELLPECAKRFQSLSASGDANHQVVACCLAQPSSVPNTTSSK